MRDGTVIPGGGQADDRRILHGDCQEPRKSPFHRSSLVINRFEVLGIVIDRVADAWRKAKKIVAPFLIHELGMSGRTEKILPSIGFVPMKRTRVLKVDSALRRHPTLPMHGKIGRTEDAVLLEAERVVLRPAGIDGDDGMGFHLEGDVRQDVFAVIIGISGDCGNWEGEGRGLFKHGNGNFLFVPIIRTGDFINREFGFCVDDDMVSVAPVERHLRLEGLGKMDFDAEPGVGIAARKLRLVEAVFDRGFEVVLSDVGLNGTGVQGDNAAGDDFFFDQSRYEFLPKILQVLVGCRAEEAGEAFARRGTMKHRKSAGHRDGGVVLQFEGQIGQRGKAAETLIDQSSKKRFPGKGRTSSDADLLSPCRQMGEQLFETDPRRDLFGPEKRKNLHDTLDFREGRRKTSFSRVSEALGLGYVFDSYEKRSIWRRRGVAQKSAFLTRSKTSSKIGENQAFSITGDSVSY
jgi:hypothetical protein